MSPKSAQFSVFLFLLLWNPAAYNSRRLSRSKRWRRASTRSSNDPSRTSGLSCLYAACALPVRRTRSHRVFSFFHLLIQATPSKWFSQSVKLPSPLKASDVMLGLLTLILPTTPNASRFRSRARGSRRQTQRTSMHGRHSMTSVHNYVRYRRGSLLRTLLISGELIVIDSAT